MTEHRPLTDLIGLDPNFTGGLSAEEHLRRQRCGECDEALDELAKAKAEAKHLERERDEAMLWLSPKTIAIFREQWAEKRAAPAAS